MDSSTSSPAADDYLYGDETALKVVVAGPFGVGKTTLVGALSDIRPLRTEETITTASIAADDLTGTPEKTLTTVAMDFGRLRLSRELMLYLFGAPGQPRFLGLLDDLAVGALGALVMADTRRLDASFGVMTQMEKLGLPYAVAVNRFPDAPDYRPEQLREAMDLVPDAPLVVCDARRRDSAKQALVSLVEYLLSRTPEPAR